MSDSSIDSSKGLMHGNDGWIRQQCVEFLDSVFQLFEFLLDCWVHMQGDREARKMPGFIFEQISLSLELMRMQFQEKVAFCLILFWYSGVS